MELKGRLASLVGWLDWQEDMRIDDVSDFGWEV